MAVPLLAPRFGMTDCRNESERLFLERLHLRAERADWYADSWSYLFDHVVIAITIDDSERTSVLRDLRADFLNPGLLMGEDETHQFVTPLDPSRSGVILVPAGSPDEVAEKAADWFEEEMARQVVWERWLSGGEIRERWRLADDGRVLVLKGQWNAAVSRSLGRPDETAIVWPRK